MRHEAGSASINTVHFSGGVTQGLCEIEGWQFSSGCSFDKLGCLGTWAHFCVYDKSTNYVDLFGWTRMWAF